MTTSAEQALAVLTDALKLAWWAPSNAEGMSGLRHAALTVIAKRLTPERRFVSLLGAGAFSEAERTLEIAGDGGAQLGELANAGQLLAQARADAALRTRTSLDGLRHRSDRLGRTWDQDFAALLLSLAEDDEAEALAELEHLADEIAEDEGAMAAALNARGAELDEDQRRYLLDLIAETQWDAARHLVEHGTLDFALAGAPMTPPLARLGVTPAALLRSFSRGQDPSQRSDGWREVDEHLTRLVSAIPTQGPASALAEALRCETTTSGDVATLHLAFTGTRGTVTAITDVHLRQTGRTGELSVTLEGFEPESLLSLDRILEVLVSPGDRSWQLLRAIAATWPVDELLSLMHSSAPTLDRIEVLLDLALGSPQGSLARVVAHRAGFNMALAEALLGVALPLARKEGRMSSDLLDAAMTHPELHTAWQGTLAEFAREHPDAHRLLKEAASSGYTLVDADLLALLAEISGVEDLSAAVDDLEAAGFAAPSNDETTILHIEPMHLVSEWVRAPATESSAAPPL